MAEVERIDWCSQHGGNVPASLMVIYITEVGKKRLVCQGCKNNLMSGRNERKLAVKSKKT